MKQEQREVIGVDGEGITLPVTSEHIRKSKHLYCYMAACGTDVKYNDVENMSGLKTEECFDFLLSLPKKHLKFGFSLGYDYTKIFEDMPDRKIWLLCHPEKRQGKKRQKVVYWKNYRLDLMSGRLKISKVETDKHGPKCNINHRIDCKDGECEGCKSRCTGCYIASSVTVWDIFKFFQASFINACKDWGVINDKEFAELKAMKDRRDSFTTEEWPSIREYCQLECRKLAQLGEKLLLAHKDAGLNLSQYHGAGSTGGSMLKSMGARHFIMNVTKNEKGKDIFTPIEYPLDLKQAVASAFFGGRFEISRIGPVYQRVYSDDIASAYPYAFSFLPCLVHGKWKLISNPKINNIQNSSAALVRYELPYSEELGKLTLNGPETYTQSEMINEPEKSWRSDIPWGPFPFRNKEGNILYPVTSGGGWLWRDEIISGLNHFPNVLLKEAWVYNTNCECEVLRSSMPQKYLLRLEWGKEGKGIVIKLGCNSCYGKTAQSRGRNPPFQNFIWAGMTTSSCRAQLLDAIATAKDRRNILMVATDGIVSSERLQLPQPRDTGTSDFAKAKGKLPLGAWEEEILENGLMLIRPGVAFPLHPASSGVKLDYKKVKARGVGKSILALKTEKVMKHWEKFGPKEYKIKRPIFYGMKSCVRRNEDGRYTRDRYELGSAMNYGTWTNQTVKITYDAQPKRPFRNEDLSLCTWALTPPGAGLTSAEHNRSEMYGPALGLEKVVSALTLKMIEEDRIEADQPDKEDREESFD